MNEKKSVNRKLIIGSVAVAIIISTVMIICLTAVRSLRSATTMRLLRFDGEISLLTDSGKVLEASENKRLTNGNVIKTKKESQAWILLDEDRVVTLMEKSAASFTQNGKKLFLSLDEGRLFFNIERSLEDDEDFDIATSTMIIGIRGTSGYIDSDENGNSVLYLTTGKVEVTGLDEDGEESGSDKLKAGQKVTVISEDDAEIIVEDITESDLPFELIAFLLSDDDLLASVLEETGWDEELLRTRLSSGDEELPGAVSDSAYRFDINELTGTWYADGEQFISINGDGGGTLYYPSDGMFDSDEGSLVNITMTYELSEDYMIMTDPVHYSSGLMLKFFMFDGKVVLYDTINDRLLIKDNAFDPGDSWINNPDFRPAQIAVSYSGEGDGDSFTVTDLVGVWEEPYTLVHIEIYDDGTGMIGGAVNPGFSWWVEGGDVFFSNEYLKFENGVLMRGAISADGIVWSEMAKLS